MRTLEQYLKEELSKGKIDYMLRAEKTEQGVKFYIYPLGKNGDTVNFDVVGNTLTTTEDTFKGE